MELANKVICKDQKLFFVEGFYGKHYLIKISSSISEVMIPYELLNVLRISHDENLSIGDAFKKVLGVEANSENLNKLSKQVNWLNEKGMICLK
ncbi:hypothetical protein ABCY62_06195 [Acetivibrio clariflavus]|uniref:hypothetical protein n=1 Tax=Acetivibrio clariflavus TaxID=288965 RepID=UPI0031F4F92F